MQIHVGTMFKFSILLLLVLIYPNRAIADSMDATMQQVAKDLADLQATYDEAINKNESAPELMVYSTSAIVEDPGFSLRAAPKDSAKVIKVVQQGERFKVVDITSDWAYVVTAASSENESEATAAVTGYLPIRKGIVLQNTIWPQAQSAEYFIKPTIGGTKYQYIPPTASSSSPTTQSFYDAITRKATAIKESYENNPDIQVNGFSVEIGVTPSISIQFQFK